MINHTLQKKRGFSLVETLVAISILMISIAGPMVLVGNGIRSSTFARDQVTAFYLAQDAIEAIRYIRDGNRIEKVLDSDPESVPWDDITQYNCPPEAPSNPCGIDTLGVYNGSGFDPISTAYGDAYLTIDNEGRYGYGTGVETKFKRKITIESAEDSREVQIVVTIDWSSGVFTRTFSIRENLFYWY